MMPSLRYEVQIDNHPEPQTRTSTHHRTLYSLTKPSPTRQARPEWNTMLITMTAAHIVELNGVK